MAELQMNNKTSKEEKERMANDRFDVTTEFLKKEAEIEKIKAEIEKMILKIDKIENENLKLKEDNRILREKERNCRKQLRMIYSSKSFRVLDFGRRTLRKMNRIRNSLRNRVHRVLFRKKMEDTSQSVQHIEMATVYPRVWNKTDSAAAFRGRDRKSVSVVICVHNALEDVAVCLNSVWMKRSYPYEIILIDDGSNDATMGYLKEFASQTNAVLFRNETAQGYTKSANMGLRASKSDYIVLLNSDTIVTDLWIEKMLSCFESDKETGIVSPLSNAASYQSVPCLKDESTGTWMVNSIPEEYTIDSYSHVIEETSEHLYPCVPCLNGFCFMISRNVIEDIGYLDEESFPIGYGEEVDYCIRATEKDYLLKVVDDTYVYHAKAKRFTSQKQLELIQKSKKILENKHGMHYLNISCDMDAICEMDQIRDTVSHAIDRYSKVLSTMKKKKIAFVLPCKGGSGGANSVCQEVKGMRNFGIPVDILNLTNNKKEFEENYPELIDNTKWYEKNNTKSFIEVAQDYDMLIATLFTSVKTIETVKRRKPEIEVGYYIQDYEPMFFKQTESSYYEALVSYERIKNICAFAKTEWIKKQVESNHDLTVNLVEPSLDTELYNPYMLRKQVAPDVLNVCAMMRPSTKRRNPQGTIDVLNCLFEKLQSKVKISLFGCNDDELDDYDIHFEYVNYGKLKRWEVASLISKMDVFIDMSFYQAFGRSGIEAMSLGCVPVLPVNGGATTFAVNNKNALVVDTLDVEQVAKNIVDAFEEAKLDGMIIEGLKTAKKYSIPRASWSELNTIYHFLEDRTRRLNENT